VFGNQSDKFTVIFLYGQPNEKKLDKSDDVRNYTIPSDKDINMWTKSKRKNHYNWKLQGFNIVRELQEQGVTSPWFYANLPVYRSTFSKVKP